MGRKQRERKKKRRAEKEAYLKSLDDAEQINEEKLSNARKLFLAIRSARDRSQDIAKLIAEDSEVGGSSIVLWLHQIMTPLCCSYFKIHHWTM